jgi:hypothetical protein
MPRPPPAVRLILLAAVAAFPAAPADAQPTPPPAPSTAAAHATNHFGFDLYARVRDAPGTGNVLCSPVSASIALAMTAAGARGLRSPR